MRVFMVFGAYMNAERNGTKIKNTATIRIWIIIPWFVPWFWKYNWTTGNKMFGVRFHISPSIQTHNWILPNCYSSPNFVGCLCFSFGLCHECSEDQSRILVAKLSFHSTPMMDSNHLSGVNLLTSRYFYVRPHHPRRRWLPLPKKANQSPVK